MRSVNKPETGDSSGLEITISPPYVPFSLLPAAEVPAQNHVLVTDSSLRTIAGVPGITELENTADVGFPVLLEKLIAIPVITTRAAYKLSRRFMIGHLALR